MSTQINLSKKIAIKDEGVLKTSDVNSIDFTGTGVTATYSGNDVTVNIPGGGGGIHVLTKPVSGRTYNVRIDSATAASPAVNIANLIYLSPFIPANTLTVSKFEINVVALTGGANARMLVYSDLNGVPSSKLLESINQDCSTTGVRTYNEVFTFNAGTTYWLGLYSSAAVQFSVVNNIGLIPISSSNFNASMSVITVAAAFGSAPVTLGPPTLNAGFSMYLINLTAQ